MVLQAHFVPGNVLHFHATHEPDRYGEILVLGTDREGRNLVLILRNPFKSSLMAIEGWTAVEGCAYSWMNINTLNNAAYHPASECTGYWGAA